MSGYFEEEAIKELGPYSVDPLGRVSWALEDIGTRAIRQGMRDVSSGKWTKVILNFEFSESAIPIDGFRIIMSAGMKWKLLDYENDFMRLFRQRIIEGDERYLRCREKERKTRKRDPNDRTSEA